MYCLKIIYTSRSFGKEISGLLYFYMKFNDFNRTFKKIRKTIISIGSIMSIYYILALAVNSKRSGLDWIL